MSLSNAGMQGLKPGVCTSTTRPTNPYNGQLIYETDTKKVYIHNGTNWVEQTTSGMIAAKGDLLVGTANDAATAVSVGANSRILLADSTQTAGVRWGYPAGFVLQVQSTTKTDTFTSTSTSYTDVTGLSVSITPIATSSKILVISSLSGTGATGLTNLYAQLVRGSTAIAVGGAANLRRSATGTARDAAMTQQVSMLHLDSPATTSATTYKVQVASQSAGSTVYVNRSVTDGDDITSPRTVSTITVLEIAG